MKGGSQNIRRSSVLKRDGDQDYLILGLSKEDHQNEVESVVKPTFNKYIFDKLPRVI